MKKLVSLALALALVLALAVCPVSAAGKAVTVDVANYPIALNGQIMDNAYATYPLIIYKQITYFPMISFFVNPIARKMPIWPLCSSIRRVIVVTHTSAATR